MDAGHPDDDVGHDGQHVEYRPQHLGIRRNRDGHGPAVQRADHEDGIAVAPVSVGVHPDSGLRHGNASYDQVTQDGGSQVVPIQHQNVFLKNVVIHLKRSRLRKLKLLYEKNCIERFYQLYV